MLDRTLDLDHVTLLCWYDAGGTSHTCPYAEVHPIVDVVLTGYGPEGPSLKPDRSCVLHPVPDSLVSHRARIAYGWYFDKP